MGVRIPLPLSSLDDEEPDVGLLCVEDGVTG
jgi:hypothetical protein